MIGLDAGGPPDGRENLCEIGRYRRVSRANEHGLVILSMGISYWLMPLEEGEYGLFVEARQEEAVREQLSKYERESRYWPPAQDILPKGDHSLYSLAVYGLLLIALYVISTPDLLARGRLSAELVMNGEWWRVFTALTLHADWGHLVGNVAGGCLFAVLLSRYLGYGMAWLAILLAGGAGNLVNAWFYSTQGHLAIGASTAVFAALGLLGGVRLLRQYRLTGWRWPRQLSAPLIAGAVLLAFLGTGDERTDVMGHLWGFAAGVVLGGLVAWRGWDEVSRRWPQFPAAVTTLLLIGLAWLAAHVSGPG